MLINHAEILYTAGMKEYQAGNMDNARQDFDKALSMLLESKFRIAADELGRIMHAHPTVSESVMEAAEGVHDLTIHL